MNCKSVAFRKIRPISTAGYWGDTALYMRFVFSKALCAMMMIAPLSAASADPFLGCDAVFLSATATARASGTRPDRQDALEQAELLFSRLSQADIDAALQGLAPGQWHDLSDRFAGDDARWRFWRPMDLPDDPDALTLPPAQRQIMVRPLSDDLAVALLVAGLAGTSDRIAQPMLAGLRPSGEVFILDPTQPEGCHWPLAGVAVAVEEFLTRPR